MFRLTDLLGDESPSTQVKARGEGTSLLVSGELVSGASPQMWNKAERPHIVDIYKILNVLNVGFVNAK